LIFIAVVAGVVGGITTSMIAGASRSSSVVSRYSAALPRVDERVFNSGLSRAQMLAVPGVSYVTPTVYVAMNRVDRTGAVGDGVNGFPFVYNGERDRSIRVLAGRLPDGHDPTHLAVNDAFVSQFGLAVGDDLTVRMYSQNQGEELMNGIFQPTGPTYVFHIDAVVRRDIDVAREEIHRAPRVGAISAHQSRAYVMFPYDFWTTHHAEFLAFGEDFDVRLTKGAAGVSEFEAAIARLLPTGAGVDFEPGGNTRQASVDAPVDLETNALLGLGVALGTTAIVLVTLLLRLEQRTHDADRDPLRALGMTRAQMLVVAVVRVVPAAAGAALLTAAVAIGLSAQYPIGVGRQLELDGGLQVNVAVVVVGAIFTAVATITVTSLLALRRGELTAVAAPRTTLARWLGRRGAPLLPTLGAHLAFESSTGRRVTVTRQAVAPVAALLVVVTATGMWIAGVDDFYNDPATHGWPWDVVIGNSNFEFPAADLTSLKADTRFAGITAASYGQVTVDGEHVEALVIDGAGTAPLPVISGRAPRSSGEIALGGLTMRHHHVAIGSSVQLSLANSEFGNGGKVDVTVVGETLAPIFGESELADIEVVTFDTTAAAGIDVAPQLLLARIDPHRDRASTVAALANQLTEELTTDMVPARAVNMHRVRGVPMVGIAIASTLAALVVGYTVGAGVAGHRRELAILQAVGLERRRVRWAIAWQGGITLGFALAIGMPLGIVAGIKIWTRVAHGIGIRAHPALPAWLALPVAGIVLAATGAVGWAGRAREDTVVRRLRAD
jgi:hypothetical protein